jgi:hypothetical protein
MHPHCPHTTPISARRVTRGLHFLSSHFTMKLFWTSIFFIAVYAQIGSYDTCLNACFSQACGDSFITNLTCLCNQIIYQSIQVCLSTNCVENDFSAAQELQQQYCCCFLLSRLIIRQSLRALGHSPVRLVQLVYRQLYAL